MSRSIKFVDAYSIVYFIYCFVQMCCLLWHSVKPAALLIARAACIRHYVAVFRRVRKIAESDC